MKATETKSSSSAHQRPPTQAGTPFFQKEGGEDAFFSTAEKEPDYFFNKPHIQTKLTIGKPGDKYEQEADTMSDKVVQQLASSGAKQSEVNGGSSLAADGGGAVQSKCAECEQEEQKQISPKEESVQRKPIFESAAEPAVQMKAIPAAAPAAPIQRQEQEAPKEEEQPIQEEPLQMKPIFDSAAEPPDEEETVQRKSAECAAEEEPAVQKKADDAAAPAASPSLESRLSSSRGGGSPLPEDTRGEMEGAFGADFSGVRVHTNSGSVQMNQELGAHAFTNGSDIYFNTGQFNPSSPSGKKLLAHELTHTIQQNPANAAQSLHRKTQAEANPHIQLKEEDSPGFFDRVGDFISDTASGIRQGVSSVVDTVQDIASGLIDTVTSVISGGIAQLNNVWQGIRNFADTAITSLRERAENILSLFMSPVSQLIDALMSFNADSLLSAWNTLTNFAGAAWNGVVAFFQAVTSRIQTMWESISTLATSFFSLLSNYTSDPLFRYLQAAWQTIIRPLRAVWDIIQQAWFTLWQWITSVMQGITDTVGSFIQQIINLSIGAVVESFRNFGRTILAIRDALKDPMALVTPIIEWVVNRLQGTPQVAGDKAAACFKGEPAETSSETQSQGIIMMQEAEGGTAPVVRSSVGWSEFWSGVWRHISFKFSQLSLWDIVVDTLWTLLWPWPGVGHDLELMATNIGQTIDGLYSPGSWRAAWTGFLRILDIPIIIWRTINSILGRLWGWLFIASVIAGAFPGSAIGGFLASVIPGLGTALGGTAGGLAGAGAGAGFALAAGIPLLKSFLFAEGANMLRAVLSLTTGLSTQDEKERDYGRIAESALGLAAAGLLYILTAAAARLGATLMNFARRFIPNVVAGIEEFTGGVRQGYSRSRRGTTPVPAAANEILVDNPARVASTTPKFNPSTNQWEWFLYDRDTGAVFAYQHSPPSTVPNSGPEMTLTPHEATIPATGETVSLRSRGFSWTEISLRKMMEVYESLFGHRPGNLPGNIAWDNLANFQAEFVRLRVANPTLGEQELANAAIRNISFGKHRVAAGYSDINVTVESRGVVEVNGTVHDNVPTWVRVNATPPASH